MHPGTPGKEIKSRARSCQEAASTARAGAAKGVAGEEGSDGGKEDLRQAEHGKR